MRKNIVVISAHPDDETFGVGGTLLKHAMSGDEMIWIIVTYMHENQGFSQERILSRNDEIESVSKSFGFKKVYQLDHPTMSLNGDRFLDLVPEISQIFNHEEPEIVYCVNRSDAHSDHRITFEATMACTKSFRFPYIKRVLLYECVSETEFAPSLQDRAFVPNYFVDISEHIEKKIEIAKIYASEMGEHPFPRSSEHIRALALHRGVVAGVKYAEAFQLLKFIDK